MTLDLKTLATRLRAAGHPSDASASPAATLTALFAFAAGRAPDSPIRAIGTAAARHFPDYGMDTGPRLAEFVAQTAHETGGYARFEEDLNYSAARLVETWPHRFAADPAARTRRPNAAALRVAHRPEALANIVYARAAEGNVQPGDGWRFRGRGMLQLTFRNNYAAAAKSVGVDLVAHPELAADPATSLRIALDFWQRSRVNACCDRGDYLGARGLTNCGSATPATPPIGLKEVQARRARLLPLFGLPPA